MNRQHKIITNIFEMNIATSKTCSALLVCQKDNHTLVYQVTYKGHIRTRMSTTLHTPNYSCTLKQEAGLNLWASKTWRHKVADAAADCF